MDSTITLFVIIIILVYTLHFTYTNDFGMFLFIILLILTGLYVHEIIDDKINNINKKIDILKNAILSKFGI